jgi:hypothetical protein
VKHLSRLKIFGKEETFFLLTIKPDKLAGILIGVDQDKFIRPIYAWPAARFSDLSGRLSPAQTSKHVIVAADSMLAHTSILPVRILRENAALPIQAVEIENILAQEVGKVFSRCRAHASEDLGVDDLDIILANSRVGEFKVDGHRVLNPIGVKGEKIEAVLELILSTRTLFEDVKSLVKKREDYFFTELGRAELSALARTEKLPVRLLRMNEPSSSLLTLKDALVGQEIERKKIPWSLASLREIIRAEWGVSDAAARSLYRSFRSGEMPGAPARLLKKILDQAEAPLWREVKSMNMRGPVYVEGGLEPVDGLPQKKGRAELLPPPVESLCEHSGFTYNIEEWPMHKDEFFSAIAPFLAYYHDRSDSTVNRWLRRHLNWLGAPSRRSAM